MFVSEKLARQRPSSTQNQVKTVASKTKCCAGSLRARWVLNGIFEQIFRRVAQFAKSTVN